MKIKYIRGDFNKLEFGCYPWQGSSIDISLSNYENIWYILKRLKIDKIICKNLFLTSYEDLSVIIRFDYLKIVLVSAHEADLVH